MNCEDSPDCPCPACKVRVSRRWFLGAAGIALAAPQLLTSTFTPTFTDGTSLPAGWTAAHEGVGIYRVNHMMSAADFREVVRYALQSSFEAIYGARHDEWAKVFVGRVER